MSEYKAYGKPFQGKTSISPKFRTQGFQAEVENTVILNAIDEEIDSLLALLDSDARNKAVAESIIRRYSSIEALYKDLTDSMRKIDTKMMIMSDKITGGFSGRQVLEAAGETNQETA